MNQKIPNGRICLFSFFEHKNETNRIIVHFENLLTQKKVFDKRWGFVRKKVAGTEKSFYLGGGRIDLPKRQITFDNTAPPAEIFEYQDNNSISESIKIWCDSADIFVLCIDLQNLPETWKINRISYNIKQIDSEKTILFAAFDEDPHFGFEKKYPVDFNTYARLAVAQHIDLINGTAEGFSEELKSLLQSGYLFPYTDTQGIITPQKKRLILRKKVFCLYKSDINFGYIDCLIYCINHIYKDKNAEISITSNKLYHYITKNNGIKYNTDMKKKPIKIAVVGTQDNGKSHCISDIFRALTIMGINVNTKPYYGYPQVQSYLNSIVGNKNIDPTDITNLTKSTHHYKGSLTIEGNERIIEFMDIPGEAFHEAENITGIYTNLKSCLKEKYTHKRWKIMLTKLPNKLTKRLIKWLGISLDIDNINFLMEMDSEKGRQLSLYKGNTKSTKRVLMREVSNVDENNIHNLKAYKYVSGKDVVKNFEQYDTDNLKNVLKQIVEEIDGYANLKNISTTFWQNFYAYVFCDKSTDIILCELLALPIDAGGISYNVNTEQKNYTSCLRGVKTFFEKETGTCPNLYVVFK